MGEQNFESIELSNTKSDFAFAFRNDLINASVSGKTISDRAFTGCKNLKSITFHKGVEAIGAGALTDCESVEEIILPSTLKTISYRAFAGCRRLKRIVIPEGVETIEWGAFAECHSLEEVVLPETLKHIGTQLFLNCKSLKNISIPSSITDLPDECFKGCENLDITLNSSITKLGNRVFENCFQLKSFPSNVKSFGEYCFKNCKNIDDVSLNGSITTLPNGLFDGCSRLENIESKNNVSIGERCFKNCKDLKEIPSFIKNFNIGAFENCTRLTTIKVIGTDIPADCFKGCTRLTKIIDQNHISSMGPFAFSGCESLKEFTIYNLTAIPAEAFSNCKKLRKIKLPNGITTIESRAFFNCPNLSNINLPSTIESIKKEAFRGCNSISSITIPANLKTIGPGAFSYMDSLTHIEVSPKNKEFETSDNKVLLDKYQNLVLYANGLKDKSFSLESHTITIDVFGRELIKPIRGIKPYAFAGAKNLEELTLCSCIKDIEATTFYGCTSLKKLNVVGIDAYTSVGFSIRNNGQYYSEEHTKDKVFLPFEEITLSGNINEIFHNAFDYFNNVKKINIPSDGDFIIGYHVFVDCILLREIMIPNSIPTIGKFTFNPETKVIFGNGIEIYNLEQLDTNSNYNDTYRLYTIKDNAFYIEYSDGIKKITKKDIENACTHSNLIVNNPVLFFDFMEELKEYNLNDEFLHNGILISNISLSNRKILLEKLREKDEFFLNVFLHSGLLSDNDECTKNILAKADFSLFLEYVELLKNHNIQDRFLFDKTFVNTYIKEKPLITKLIEVYDANTKRLLKASEIMNDSDTSVQNLTDLLVLMQIAGALEKDPITRQKAATFISEKIFEEKKDNGETNESRLVGDDIHRVFNFSINETEFDQELATFFLENYQLLRNEEKIKSGFIQRVYTNFKNISKTSTSNKGSQRKLKVTMEKCKNYLATYKFEGINESNKNLARLIGEWFEGERVWTNAQAVYQESLNAPRNIFTKIKVDNENNVIYDMKPEHDLAEKPNGGFYYQWLPKQDYENLVLGKYCNCCAHIDGAGQGIMRASMILDCCQNLVIRNSFGTIVAKSTLYVNRSQGYAVFNNVESSMNYRKEEDLKGIYTAFLRGSKDFIVTYNKNNPNKRIRNISIGASRNTILAYLTDELHPVIPIQKSLEFGTYSLNGSGYAGDWGSKQRLVVRR